MKIEEEEEEGVQPKSKPTPSPPRARQRLQWANKGLTARAVLAGLFVGSILCFSNTYFGLQTGWVTMGSLQSALLGRNEKGSGKRRQGVAAL